MKSLQRLQEKFISHKEQLVLYALSSNPEKSDKENARRLNMSIQTFNDVKRRLRKSAIFSYLKVPDFSALDMSVCGFFYIKSKGLHLEKYRPEIVYSLLADRQGLYIGFAKTLDAMNDFAQALTLTFSKTDRYHIHDFNMLPTSSLRISKFCDFSTVLKRIFSLKLDPSGQEFDLQESEEKEKKEVEGRGYKRRDEGSLRKFTKRELSVLHAITRYSCLSDTKIASRIGMPRSTISSIRKRFEKENLIATTLLPDIKRLGVEVIVYVKVQYKHLVDTSLIQTILHSDINSFICADSGTEAFVVCAYQNYTQYHYDIQGLLDAIVSLGGGPDDVTCVLIPLSSVKMHVIETSALTKQDGY